MNSRGQVIVVGAGVLGAFHAYFAAQKGYAVKLLERNRMPADASTRNFGMLPRTIVEVESEWEAYAADSANIYRTIQARTDISIRSNGSLYLASTDAERTVLEEFAASYTGRYPCQLLDGPEVARRYPFVRESYCQAGLVFPTDLSLDPGKMLATLIPWMAKASGIEYYGGADVLGVERRGACCVVWTADGRQLAGDYVVVCSGAEALTLFPETLKSADLRLCKLQMMQTVPLPNYPIGHSILSGLSIRRYPAFRACSSYGSLASSDPGQEVRDFGIHVLAKQAADGSVIIGDSHEYFDLDRRAEVGDRNSGAIDEAILKYARAMLDLPSWQIAARWNGFYLTHPSQPIFSVKIDERIHLVTAIAGKGMTTAPGFARQSIAALLPDA